LRETVLVAVKAALCLFGGFLEQEISPRSRYRVTKQHAYRIALRIAGDDVNFTVSIYVAQGQSPGSPARRERRVGRWFEATASVTEHDANTITCRGNHVHPAIMIHLCED